MIGRGLRSHPNKMDCVTIDFGISTSLHGTLEQDVLKSIKEKNNDEYWSGYSKICPDCHSEIPAAHKICFICRFEF